MENKLKAYLFTFYKQDDDKIKSVIIIGYDKDEAINTFVVWTNAKNIIVISVIVKSIRRSKKNAGFFTKEYYKKQCDFMKMLKMNDKLRKE